MLAIDAPLDHGAQFQGLAVCDQACESKVAPVGGPCQQFLPGANFDLQTGQAFLRRREEDGRARRRSGKRSGGRARRGHLQSIGCGEGVGGRCHLLNALLQIGVDEIGPEMPIDQIERKRGHGQKKQRGDDG